MGNSAILSLTANRAYARRECGNSSCISNVDYLGVNAGVALGKPVKLGSHLPGTDDLGSADMKRFDKACADPRATSYGPSEM